MIFERASRLNLRFRADIGVLSVEDLWELSLEQLDHLYGGLCQDLADFSANTLLKKANPDEEIVRLRIDIIKHIVKTLQKEAKERTTALENSQEKAKILNIIEAKKEDELKEKSITDLKKMARKLG